MTDEMKLPAGNGGEALNAYFRAVNARRCELVARAKDSLPEDLADVERTHQACVDLGLLPPTGKKARTPRTAAGTVADRILTAIDAGHHTPRTIADHAGTALGTVQVTLGKMLAAGQVARDGDRGAYRWRRP